MDGVFSSPSCPLSNSISSEMTDKMSADMRAPPGMLPSGPNLPTSQMNSHNQAQDPQEVGSERAENIVEYKSVKQRDTTEEKSDEVAVGKMNSERPPLTSLFSASFGKGTCPSVEAKRVVRPTTTAPSCAKPSSHFPFAGVPGEEGHGGGSGPVPHAPQQISLATSSSTHAIAARQQELQNTVSQHIELLERTITIREEEIAAAYRQLAQVEEDYQFNLSLISERDNALCEASSDISKAYGELSSIKLERDEARRLQQGLEEECRVLHDRVRLLESERSQEWTKWRNEAGAQIALWEGKYLELEQQTKRKGDEEHAHYMALVAELEEERERLRISREAAHQQYKASIAELKKNSEEEDKKMQAGLLEAINAQELAKQEKVALEARYQELQREAALQEQRHAIALEAIQRGKTQEREMLLKDVDERISSVDTALRAAISGRQEAEQKSEALAARVASLEREAQAHREEQEAAAARWATERQELESQVQTVEAMRLAATREHKADCQHLEVDCQALRHELNQVKREAGEMRNTRDEWREKTMEKEREVERLREEVVHWKDEEERTAAKGKANLLRTMERVQELEDAVEEMKDTMREQQVRFHDITESAQGEASRLRQELHASEVARAALEEQFHLLRDTNKAQLLLESTQAEKEQLAKRVMQLEHVNAEVRQQVATFTLELQNDPIIKGAKEYAVRIPELQRQLLDAQCEHQILREKLKEREEELSRSKLELLQYSSAFSREATLASSPGNAFPPTASTTLSSATPETACTSTNQGTTAGGCTACSHGHTCSSTLQQEHEVLRALYEKLQREVKTSRSRHSQYLLRELMGSRRLDEHSTAPHAKRKRNKRKSGSSPTSSASFSSSSRYSTCPSSGTPLPSSSGDDGGESRLGPPPTPGGSTQRCRSQSQHWSSHSSSAYRHGGGHHRRHHHYHGGGGVKKGTSSSGSSFSSRSSSARHRQLRSLEKSIEAWEKKCLELEWHLQQTIQQRDAAQRQSTALELEKSALLRQVQSLTELNTFLKSQWRQQQELRAIGASASTSSPARETLTTSASTLPLGGKSAGECTNAVSPDHSQTTPAAALLRLLLSPSQLQQVLNADLATTHTLDKTKDKYATSVSFTNDEKQGSSSSSSLTRTVEGKEEGGASVEIKRNRGDESNSGQNTQRDTSNVEPYASRLRAVEEEIAAMQDRIAKTSSKCGRTKRKSEGSTRGSVGSGGATHVGSSSAVLSSLKGGPRSYGSSLHSHATGGGGHGGARNQPSNASRESWTSGALAVRRGYGAVRHYGVPVGQAIE